MRAVGPGAKSGEKNDDESRAGGFNNKKVEQIYLRGSYMNSDHLREKWSEVYPKNSIPTTVPANVIEATFFCAGEFVYASPYIWPSIVLTEPMT